MQVNAETLQAKVKRFEGLKQYYSASLSLNEEYQLEAYKMLLDYMDKYAELQERYDLHVNPEGK